MGSVVGLTLDELHATVVVELVHLGDLQLKAAWRKGQGAVLV
jgi:hypothetical protein